MVTEERLWCTPQGEVFAGDDPPEGSQLIAGAGSEVSDGNLERFGLTQHSIRYHLVPAPESSRPQPSPTSATMAALVARVVALEKEVHRLGGKTNGVRDLAASEAEADRAKAAEAKAKAKAEATKAVAGPGATK